MFSLFSHSISSNPTAPATDANDDDEDQWPSQPPEPRSVEHLRYPTPLEGCAAPFSLVHDVVADDPVLVTATSNGPGQAAPGQAPSRSSQPV